MKNLTELSRQMESLKNEIEDQEKNVENSFYKKFKFKNEKTKVSLVNNEFLSIKIADYSDLTNFFKNCKPYKTAHRVKHGSFEHDIINPYKVDLESNIKGGVYMKFTTYLINDFMIWVKININSVLPSYLIDKYTSPYQRKITDSEHHYYTGMSYKELNKIRIQARNWRGYQLDWYGGDKTLLSHDKNTVYSSVLDNFLNELTNNPNLARY